MVGEQGTHLLGRRYEAPLLRGTGPVLGVAYHPQDLGGERAGVLLQRGGFDGQADEPTPAYGRADRAVRGRRRQFRVLDLGRRIGQVVPDPADPVGERREVRHRVLCHTVSLVLAAAGDLVIGCGAPTVPPTSAVRAVLSTGHARPAGTFPFGDTAHRQNRQNHFRRCSRLALPGGTPLAVRMSVTQLPYARPVAAGRVLPSVAVICRNQVVRGGLERLVADSPDVAFCCAVTEAAELTVRRARPDLLLLDAYPVRGAVGDPLPAVPVGGRALVLCPPDTRVDLAAGLRAGVHAYLTRDAEADEMLTALRIVAAGGAYVCAELAPSLRTPTEPVTERRPRLASREIETLRWVAQGYTHGQIGRRMGLTEATVNTYVKRIRSKLNAGNKAELTRRAIELGYVLSS